MVRVANEGIIGDRTRGSLSVYNSNNILRKVLALDEVLGGGYHLNTNRTTNFIK